MARSHSLLERLGGKAKFNQPQPVPAQPAKVEDKPMPTYNSRTQATNELNHPQEASAFSGRHSATNAPANKLQDFKMSVHRRIVDEMTPAEQAMISQGESAREQIKNIISAYSERELAENAAVSMTRGERFQIIDDICDELLGLGPLEPLLKDEQITEIMINGPKDIFIEQKGRLMLTDTHFHDDAHLMSIIERILTPLGRRVDESSPLVDARLADGSRVNIIIPPLSLVGPAVTIRKFSKKALSVNDLVKFGTLSNDMASFLEACVRARLNILVSGGTRSTSCRRSSRRPIGSLRSKMRRSSNCNNVTSSHWKRAPQTSRAEARSRSEIWLRTRCACAPIGSSSARSARVKRSTCCKR